MKARLNPIACLHRPYTHPPATPEGTCWSIESFLVQGKANTNYQLQWCLPGGDYHSHSWRWTDSILTIFAIPAFSLLSVVASRSLGGIRLQAGERTEISLPHHDIEGPLLDRCARSFHLDHGLRQGLVRAKRHSKTATKSDGRPRSTPAFLHARISLSESVRAISRLVLHI